MHTNRVEILAQSEFPDAIQHLKREIQMNIGTPPAGAEFVVFDADNVLAIRYLPYDPEAVGYVQGVLLFLSNGL